MIDPFIIKQKEIKVTYTDEKTGRRKRKINLLPTTNHSFRNASEYSKVAPVAYRLKLFFLISPYRKVRKSDIFLLSPVHPEKYPLL